MTRQLRALRACFSARAERAQAGAGSVLVIAAIGFVLSCGLAVLTLVSGLSQRESTQAAADFAALAAAAQAFQGSTIACTQARQIATRNGSAVVSCPVNADDVQVNVVSLNFPHFYARARAQSGLVP